VFVFDSSRSVGAANFDQQLNAACSIVEALAAMSPAATPDSTVFDLGIRVAAIRYSETATVSFDFLEGSTAAAICSSLTSIAYVPGDFTLMHTAFRQLVALFNNPDAGFRGTLYNVPSEMIMFTDADSLSTSKIFEELANLKGVPTHHLYRTVIRLTYGTENVLHQVIMSGIVDDAGLVEKCVSAECLSNTTDLVATVSNGIMARAPCATGCVPRANIMFLVDSSTSIEEVEAGGAPGDYQAIRKMIGDTIGHLSQYVDKGYMQVGAMTFATDATLRISLGKSTAATLQAAVAGLPYDHEEGGDDVTDTNLHKALAAVSRMEAFSAPRSAAKFIVVVTDGAMRNQAGDASSLLESELDKLDAKTERIVMATGSRSDEATLSQIASRSGYSGRVSDTNASASVAQQVLDAAGLCLSEDDIAFTTPAPAKTSAAIATGATTQAATGTSALVDDSACQVLKVPVASGCETLVSNLGCANPYVAILCASSCDRCASDCAAFHPDDLEKCVRCKNNKYLSNFECVDTCGEGLVPVQTGEDDSAYGRACVAVGGMCDDQSPTQQCKPPSSLGSCRVSLLTKTGSRCQECEDGKFLVKGKCFSTLRCKGQYLEREIEDQVKCNCHFKVLPP